MTAVGDLDRARITELYARELMASRLQRGSRVAAASAAYVAGEK